MISKPSSNRLYKKFFQVSGLKIFLLASLFLLPLLLFGQIDVRPFATDDLFSAKPIFTPDKITPQGDKKVTSWFEKELNEGAKLWSMGAYEEAIYLYENLIDQYPEEPILYYNIGLISYERNRFEEANEYFIETLNKEPLFLEAKYMLGLIAIEDKDLKTAKNHFNGLLRLPVYQSYGFHGMGLISLNEGNLYKAVRNFKKCIQADSTFLEAYVPLISLYIYFGKMESAKKVVENGIKINPEWEKGIFIRGVLALLEDEDTDQFERDINRLIEISPNNYHYYSMKGYLQMELKNYHEAVRLFRAAYNLEVDSIRSGEFKFSSKFNKEEAIQRSLNYYFDNYAVAPDMRNYLDRAICELISDNKKEALILLDSANLIEENAISYTFKGAVYKSMYKKGKQTINSFSKAIDIDSAHWTAYSYRGDEHLADNNLAAAYKDFDQVVRLKPKAKEGYKNRGAVLLASGYFTEAYKDFSYGIALDPTDYDLYFNRALTAIELGQYSHAEFDLNFIINNKIKDGEAYYVLYKTSLLQKDTLEALVHLDSASKFSKKNKLYHEELLKMAASKNLIEVCISAHNRLVKHNPWHYDYLLSRAKFLCGLGRYDEAIEDLNKFLKHKKGSGEGFFYLGKATLELGHEKESDKYFKKAKKLGFISDQ